MDVWEHWYSLKLYFELRCFLDGQITCILFHWLLFWWFEDYPRRPLKGNFRMAQKQNKQQSSKSGCLLLSDCSAADNADGVELLTMPAVTVHVSAWWLGNLTSQCPTEECQNCTGQKCTAYELVRQYISRFFGICLAHFGHNKSTLTI